MLSFIKRNLKFVIVIAVSFVIIAGLSTALILTNVGTGHARGRDRDRGSSRIERVERVELTEEQIAERLESRRERLEQRLADGRITQEEYDERIAAIESGEYVPGSRGGGGSGSGSRSRGNKGGDREDKQTIIESNEDVPPIDSN